jgi:hypothetical protein
VVVVIPEEQYEGLAAELSPSPTVLLRSPAHLVVAANW